MNLFNSRKRNRKAQVNDMAFLIVTITTICITLIVARLVYVKIDQAIKGSGMNTTESDAVFADMSVMFPMFDTMMLFVVVGLTIGLLITSYQIPSHPIFLVINIVGLIVLVFVSMILSNLYHDIQQQEDINDVLTNSTAVGTFDRTNFIMNRLPWICAIIIFISTIVMFAKGRGEQGY